MVQLLYSSPSPHPTAVTVIGDDNYYPYSYMCHKDKIPKGVYPRILQAAFSKMEQYDVEIVMLPWKEGLQHIKEGNYFAIFPPYHLPDKRPYIAPYSMRILEEKNAVFCNPKTLEEHTLEDFPEDFENLRFANNTGFRIGGGRFWQMVKEGKITIDESVGTRDNLQKVIDGKCNCYINDSMAVREMLGNMQHDGKVRPVSFIKTEWGHLGYAKKDDRFPFKEAFIREFDNILLDMIESGEVERIVEKFLKEKRTCQP